MPARDRVRWIAGGGLVGVAAAVVLWVRLLPLSLAAVPLEARDLFRHRGGDGLQHVYLGDYDSYLWVRQARNVLRTGTPCDAVVAGECRDTFANAPVGAPMRYAHSLHVAAIVAVHRVLDALFPGTPLTTSAYWVPVLVGVAGVVPALGIGWHLAGPLAGLVAAIVIGVNSLFLYRSIGGDNDVWNVVLPLWAVWAAIAACEPRTTRARRLVLAALAGGAVALHAATWSGWFFTATVVAIGFGATALLSALRVLAGRERAHDLGWTLAAAGCLAVVATAGVALSGATILAVPRALADVVAGMTATTLPPAPAPAPGVAWPDVFATVGELAGTGLPVIAGQLQSPLYFFVAWLGLLLLLLPESGWQWWHFAILVGGNLLYRYLLYAPPLAATSLVGLLALPLLVGGALAVFEPDAPGRRGGLIVVAWFLSALFQSFAGIRFVMLLVPPFGILLGVAMGRLHAWLVRVLAPRVPVTFRRPLPALVFAACAAVVGPIVAHGADVARGYRPMVNDAWWDALTHLRETSPPDATVTAWWDYGHWIKYVAERRVTSDGSTLSGRVAHWIGRVLLAPTDREAAGLLRMLDCGSDVGPAGAMGRLAAHGVAEPAAYELVSELASLGRGAARARLLAQGLAPAAADDVLEATHCTPPPAYLVLTTAMTMTPAWRQLGGGDPRRVAAVSAVRAGGAEAAAATLRDTFGMSDAAARALAERAARLQSAAEVDEFLRPRLGYLVTGWIGCGAGPSGEWTCPVGRPVDAAGTILDAVRYRPDDPASTRLRLHGRVGTRDGEPATLVIAGPDRAQEIGFEHPADERIGVLVDVPGRRVLVGAPYLLRSAFTGLVFLDGRTLPSFEKVDERAGFGERVTTWRVRSTTPEDDAPRTRRPG